MKELIEIVLLSVVAYAWSEILLRTNMLFARVGRLLNKLPLWLRKPLGTCYICFSGQLSLWYYVIEYGFDFVGIAWFTCATMTLVQVVKKIVD